MSTTTMTRPLVNDLTGQTYGTLLALSRVKDGMRAVRWHVRCLECGHEFTRDSWSIRTGKATCRKCHPAIKQPPQPKAPVACRFEGCEEDAVSMDCCGPHAFLVVQHAERLRFQISQELQAAKRRARMIRIRQMMGASRVVA